MTFATTPDGVRIRIHRLGGTGPPLLCVHATGFHGRIWEPFVPKLRERFSIVAFDQRGHGDSDKPPAGYDWHRFGDDVLSVVDELSLERAVGIGHSAGAAALVFAETSRPGTFSKLVLMDPVTPEADVGAVMASGESNPLASGARRRRAIWPSPDEMAERLRTGTPLSGWREDFIRAYVTYGLEPLDDGTFRLRCPPEIESQIYVMGGRHDGWARLASLEPPTLMLTGVDSPMWFGERADRAVERIPHGIGRRVRGGHFFPMEHPDETLDAVLPFVDGSPA
jgi:pimeloyl-ACP methyl ester carboxylesterase